MSILIISIPWIFIDKFVDVVCIPKIGHVLYDPLAYDTITFNIDRESMETSDSYLFDDVEHNLRKTEESVESRKPCDGYEFDENKCLEVNGRLLCGYNKNVGKAKNEDIIVDLGNGCRQRGGRIECGYVEGPFDISPRRPPALGRSDEPVPNKRIRLKGVVSSTPKSETAEPTKLKAIFLGHQYKTTTDQPAIITTDESTVIDTTTRTRNKTTPTIPNITTHKATTIQRSTQSPVSTTTLKIMNNTLTSENKPAFTANLTSETIETISSPSKIKETPSYMNKFPEIDYLRELIRLSEARRNNVQDTTNEPAEPDTTSTLVEEPKPINSTTNNTYIKTLCVEKGDRIVCYDFNA